MCIAYEEGQEEVEVEDAGNWFLIGKKKSAKIDKHFGKWIIFGPFFLFRYITQEFHFCIDRLWNTVCVVWKIILLSPHGKSSS